jgi:hypothetical protein
MQALETLSKPDLLSRARQHYFSLGVDDGAANLCQSNFQFGLAKIHFAQNRLGITPNATFVATPDETISRNTARWRSGYGYGGKLVWGDPHDPLIFIDAKPNACGMLVGGLDEIPRPTNIIKNINRILSSEIYIDNIKLKWDFKKGNHFIDVFETDHRAMELGDFPQYMFIIHGSVPELQAETEKGVGLYYDKSETLKDMAKKINTPFGPLLYLDGTDANDYLEFFEYAKVFAAQKRIKAAEQLFGQFEIISNPMHQGLISFTELLLGAQHISEDSAHIFPVALRGDLPAFLIKSKPNLTPEQIEILGFEKRAQKLDVFDRLTDFNAVPHGGGYAFLHISKVMEVREIDHERFFICEQENENGISIMNDPSAIEFSYRGKKIINKILDLDLGKVVAKLYPRFVLKI